jgi:hypothetical protein
LKEKLTDYAQKHGYTDMRGQKRNKRKKPTPSENQTEEE